MKKWLWIIVGVVWIYVLPCSAGLMFYDDCESPIDTTKWAVFPAAGTIAPSSERSYNGDKSYKITFIGKGIKGNQRVEIVPLPDVHLVYGQDYWYGWAMYVPSDFELPTAYALSGQFHAVSHNSQGVTDWKNPCDQCPRPPASAMHQPLMIFWAGSSAAPQMKMHITGSALLCQAVYSGSGCTTNYNNSKDTYFPIIKGDWNTFVLHYRPVYLDNGTAVTELWVNGIKYTASGPNAHYDGLGPYFKLGIYGVSTKTHVLYFDELRGAVGGSYGLVAPRSGGLSDTDSPILSGFTPTGALPANTAVQLVSFRTDEVASCRGALTAAVPWASMTPISGDGTLSHSWPINGLSPGNTYRSYYKCRDTSGNESDEYVHQFTVDDMQGGAQNLINANTITMHAAGANWAKVFDGCVESQCTAMSSNVLNYEIGLPGLYDLSMARVFGDAEGAYYRCTTWTMRHKQHSGDAWITAVDAQSCDGTQWFDQALSGVQARYVRFEFTSSTGMPEVREIELHGLPVNIPPVLPTIRGFRLAGQRAGVKATGIGPSKNAIGVEP
jgi:hypothetical protein